MPLRLATRGSRLARWQAAHVAELVRAQDPTLQVDLVIVETQGDRQLDRPIEEIGGVGVFAKEVQLAVVEGRADLAVHSAKDLPSAPELQVPGLVIAAVPPRADPRDALVGARVEELPEGAKVATGSARRRVQLLDLRPDLEVVELRGNIERRLEKVGEVEAVMVAVAALDRLGLRHRASEVLEPATFVPQVGQGALAVECWSDDGGVRAALALIDDDDSRLALEAERAFLAALGGGCEAATGAHVWVEDDRSLGAHVVHEVVEGWLVRLALAAPAGSDPVAFGQWMADRVRG